MSFEKAMEIVFRHEGGYVNDPDDPGGETKYGISKRSYPELDITGLTKEEAKEIYKRDWWNKYKFCRLPGEVGIKIMDLAINIGAKPAIKILQEAGNNVVPKDDPRDYLSNLEVDGIIGDLTIFRIYDVFHDYNRNLIDQIRLLAIKRYIDIIERNPIQIKYLKGWIKRVLA